MQEKFAKSIMAIVMAAAVAVSITACGTKKSATPTTSESSVSSGVSSSEVASESEAISDSDKPEGTLAPAESTETKNEPASEVSKNEDKKPDTKTQTPSKPTAATSAPNTNTGKEDKKNEPTYTFTVHTHPATCTAPGYDEHICAESSAKSYNDNFKPAKGHSWDGGKVTNGASYYEAGVKTFTCKDCGATRTEEIPALNKTYHVQKVVAPTCTQRGYTIYECNEDMNLTYKADYKDALGHKYDDGVVTTEPTIYAKGVKTFTCKDCKATYTENIPMVEKTWHRNNTVEPTCTERGYTVYVCDQDENLTEKRDFVDAKGHDWDDGKVTVVATCEEDGIKVYTCKNDGATKEEIVSAIGHDYELTGDTATCEGDGVKTYQCKNDASHTKTEDSPALGHDWNDGEITTAATCVDEGIKTFTCNRDVSHTRTETIAALGHSYDDGVVTKEPTFSGNGIKTYTCTACGDIKTETIPAKKFTFTVTVVKPTCTEQGYTHHECNEFPERSYDDNFVDPVGHNYETVITPATCGKDGSLDDVCTVCGDKVHISILHKTNNHTWDNGVVTAKPTESADGVKTYTCTVCGETKTIAIPKDHVHTFDRLGDIIKEPTCTEKGEREAFCTVDGCDAKTTISIDALDHDWDYSTNEVVKKGTCTEPGTMRTHCKREHSHTMDFSYGGTGHTWNAGTITTNPTYNEFGVRTYRCIECGATREEKILPTKYTFTVTVIPPTCTEMGYTRYECNEDSQYSYNDNYMTALGHDGHEVVVEPTCTKDGKGYFTCKRCEYRQELYTLPATGHTYDSGVVTTPPTETTEGVKTFTCTKCGDIQTFPIDKLASTK